MGRNRRKANKKPTPESTAASRQQELRRVPQMTDRVTESDDEEIPEDEAFNSDDERKWGAFFSSSSPSPSKNKKIKLNLSRDQGDGNDTFSEDKNEGDDNDEHVTSNGDGDENGYEYEQGEGSEGNYDDEGDEVEDDGGQYMLDLLNSLDKDNGEKQKQGGQPFGNNGPKADAANHVPESEYSAFIPSKQLTIDSLMNGLQDTQGFGEVQKTFRKKQAQTTTAPVQRVVADRTQRKIVYEKESKDISAWTTVVQENRRAETLDFRPQDRINVTRDTIVNSFVPTTNLEKELDQALVEAGQKDEEDMIKAEEEALQDDLGARRLTVEEYQKRRGQLAQMRAILFYQEQKRHHMNKIKSKKYRKIRKKQRERIKESELVAALEDDDELAQELKEKEEVSRIQERMTLAHKNTSKWAKRVLKRGKNADLETRRALSAQLQRGDELRRKMIYADDQSSDRDDDSDEDLVDAARKILKDARGADETDKLPESKSGLFQLTFMKKGIQKQRERAQEEARKLLSELEANENDDYDDTDNGGDDYEDDDNDGTKTPTEKVASAVEMRKVLRDGSLVATSLNFGGSNAVATSGGIEVHLPSDVSEEEEEFAAVSQARTVSGTSSEHASTLEPVSADEKQLSRKSSKKRLSKTSTVRMSEVTEPSDKVPASKEEATKPRMKSTESRKKATLTSVPTGNDDVLSDDDSNPWIASSPSGAMLPSRRKRKSSVTKAGVLNVEGVVNSLEIDSRSKGSKRKKINDQEGVTEPSDKTNITDMTQEQLVRKAFATLSEKDIEEEFAQEKRDMIANDDPEYQRKNKRKKSNEPAEVAGWGSWTGQGTVQPLPAKRKLPAKLRAPLQKKQEAIERQDYCRSNVIINEKRIKRMANSYMLGEIPHPFASRAEYEQSMLGGIGREWNVTGSFKIMTRPEILTRSGKIIQPISKQAKQARPAAKF